MRHLEEETASARAVLEQHYTTQLEARVAEHSERLEAMYDEKLLKMSLQHDKTMSALSARYSAVMDEMASRVENLSGVLQRQAEYQQQADALQRLNSALAVVEQLQVRTIPYSSYTETRALIYAH